MFANSSNKHKIYDLVWYIAIMKHFNKENVKTNTEKISVSRSSTKYITHKEKYQNNTPLFFIQQQKEIMCSLSFVWHFFQHYQIRLMTMSFAEQQHISISSITFMRDTSPLLNILWIGWEMVSVIHNYPLFLLTSNDTTH